MIEERHPMLVVFYRDPDWSEEFSHQVECILCGSKFPSTEVNAHLCEGGDPEDVAGDVCPECVGQPSDGLRERVMRRAEELRERADSLGPEFSRERVKRLPFDEMPWFCRGCYCTEDLRDFADTLEEEVAGGIVIDRAVREL